MKIKLETFRRGCYFLHYDMYNSNPINPKKLCVLYQAMNEEKPECEDCKITHVTINMEE